MKKRLISLLLLMAVILECALLFSCSNDPKKYNASSFDYFDTVTTVTGYAKSREEFNGVYEYIIGELQEYHQLFDIYKRYGELENLATVNELRDGEHRTVTVDKRIIDLLLFAKEMYYETDGYVNVAMGSVLSIWHKYREEGSDDPYSARIPTPDMLEEASEHTSINSIVIDEAASTVTITDPKVTLDVGAIAKGYAVEMIARDLEARDITGYVINVGGNVRTIGKRGDGKLWTVGVENPLDDEDEPYISYLGFAGEALVTSGSYQRYYMVGDVRYHHIIDKNTLMPADMGYVSVSILTKDSALGDALSTALFCMSLEDGMDLIDSLDGTEAMWVMDDGEKHYSDDYENYEIER